MSIPFQATLASLLFLKHIRSAWCLYLRALPGLPPSSRYLHDWLTLSFKCLFKSHLYETYWLPCLKLQPPIPLSCFPPLQSFLSNDFYYNFYTHLLPLNCKLCEFLLIKYLNHLINWILLSIMCQTLLIDGGTRWWRQLRGLMREEMVTITSNSSFIASSLWVKCLPYILTVMTANIYQNRLCSPCIIPFNPHQAL